MRLKCDEHRLFEYAMIVTLQPSDTSDVCLEPHVLFCFPHEVIFLSSLINLLYLWRNLGLLLHFLMYYIYTVVVYLRYCLIWVLVLPAVLCYQLKRCIIVILSRFYGICLDFCSWSIVFIFLFPWSRWITTHVQLPVVNVPLPFVNYVVID